MFLLVGLISASNYITSVALFACYGVYTFLVCKNKYENRKLHTWLFGLYLVIFALNVLSPGNASRATMYVQPTLPFIAGFSLRDFFGEASIWISTTLTVTAILISSIFAKDLVKRAKIKFTNPFFFDYTGINDTHRSVCAYNMRAWVQGSPCCENIRFMTFQISLWVMAINLFGYIPQKTNLLP